MKEISLFNKFLHSVGFLRNIRTLTLSVYSDIHDGASKTALFFVHFDLSPIP